MNKTRKNQGKILNRVLMIAMMLSLLAGTLTIEVKAASSTHTHNGYTAINSSNWTKLMTPGNYYLTENITINSGIEIKSGTVNLCLNGKKISGSSSYNTSLFVVEDATLNIYDCVGSGILTGGKGYDNGSKKGGAIYLRHSTLNMYGGTITGNTAAWGGAVFIDGSDKSSTFNMYGGTISSNTAQKGGGGIEVENSNSYLNMYAGSIINNSVTNTDGGLHKGGGVHFAAGTVTIYGTYGDVIIKDNTVAGVANNLYLRADKVITVDSTANISSNSSIGVSSSDCENSSAKETIVSGYGAGNNRCFFLDGTNSSSHLLVYDSGSVSIVKKVSHTHSMVQQPAIEATCVEDGRKACYVCSSCGNLYKDAQGTTAVTAEELKIDKLGHDWVQGEVTAPTIDSVGITPYTCNNCGDTKEDKVYLSINDAKINVETVNVLTYNGQVQSQKIRVYYEGELLSEDTHYTLSGNVNTNAGNYNLTITGKGAFEGERTLTYTIAKAPLTVSVVDNVVTYGDAIPTYTVTYSGFVNGENQAVLGGELVFDCDYAQYSNVGDYDVTVSGYQSDNYEITYVNGNVKVDQKVVGLEWGSLIFIYNGSAQLPTATITGLVNDDTCTVTVTGEKTNAGVYTATATALSNGNYKLPATTTVEFVIQKAIEADEVTSEDKAVIEEALEILKDLLAEENAGNLTAEEKANIEKQKAELEEKLGNINAAEEKMETVEDTVNTLPKADEVTSENKSAIEDALDVIEDLLAEENAGNLTAEEKANIEKQKADLEEKLGNINAAEKKMETVEDTVNTLPKADEVTSENKSAIENALDVIEDLLAEENAGNLTAEEKANIEKQKADLEEKLGNINVAEKKMETVEDTVNTLPKADEVTSENKSAIEDALDVIKDLLAEENAGNLTAEEKANIEKQKVDLEEKLGNINAAEKKMETVEDTVNTLPKADEVTSENKSAIEDALDVIEDLLAKENAGNLTAEEKAMIEKQKADLEEKLEVVQIVEDKVSVLQNEKINIPSKDVITTESKDEVLELLNIIKDLQENNPNNLTEEQSDVIENLREELQEKQERIQEIEEALNKVDDESAAQPDYDDITSDNKENIKDIIDNIDNILEDDKDNLSEEEIKELEEQKKELEEKLEFIKQIENYEPVVDDFENTTKPEKNDKNGNLQNESHELIEIIPLEKTEKEHIAKGEGVKVYLEVTDITETITEEEKELIETKLEKEEVAVYLDLILFKQIGNRAPMKVPNTNGVVTITFQVPSDLINQDALVTRTYKIIRVHEGETVFIDAVFDEATGEISFETDKFSTYALVYNDVAEKVPQMGDITATWSWMFLMLGFGLLAFAGKARSMSELKKR